jgi:thymidylate synthase (FAD)
MSETNEKSVANEQRPIRFLYEPRVYLVGRPALVETGLARFFDDEEVNFLIQDRPVNGDGKQHARTWNTNTENAGELLCMTAGKICYDAYGKGRNDIEAYLQNIIGLGHGSVLEHVSWNFIIAGVSRVFSHEHVRHRAGVAISQRSQRYVKENDAGQIAQPIVEANPEAKAIWEETVRHAQQSYDKLVKLLSKDLKEAVPDTTLRIKTVRSAARGIMPNSTETYLFWTANARALRHYIELRSSQHAEIEIRRVAVQLLRIMQKEAPTIFGDYEVRPLKDGTYEAHTPHAKV